MRVCEILFPPQPDVWRFNPSIWKIRDDLFAMCYRSIRKHDAVIEHPWQLWEDLQAKTHPNQSRKCGSHNFAFENESRLELGPGLVYGHSDVQTPANANHDSTYLTVVRIPSDFRQPYIHVQEGIELFGNEMNRDCRIQQGSPNVYKLTYNGIITSDMCMLTRDMTIPLDAPICDTLRNVSMTKEQYCCAHYADKYKREVEKNWSYVVSSVRDTYIYRLQRDVTIIHGDTGEQVFTRCDAIGDLMDAYGHENFVFSLGSPTVPWGDAGYVTVGHLKIAYNTMPKVPPRLHHLVDKFGPLQKLHNKFLYFMFFVRLDKCFNVTHLSNAFIPTDATRTSHYPFALVFPCGLYVDQSNNSALVSYGEGDVRCKIMKLYSHEIHRLLVPVGAITPTNYDYYISDRFEDADSKEEYRIPSLIQRKTGKTRSSLDAIFDMIHRLALRGCKLVRQLTHSGNNTVG
jgi:hypothetical protein